MREREREGRMRDKERGRNGRERKRENAFEITYPDNKKCPKLDHKRFVVSKRRLRVWSTRCYKRFEAFVNSL